MDRDLLTKWWLTPLLLAASAAFIYTHRLLYPPRKCVLGAAYFWAQSRLHSTLLK